MHKQLVYIPVVAVVPDFGDRIPDQGLPDLPGVPGLPDQGLPDLPPGAPDQGLPDLGPGAPDQGLPPAAGRPPRPPRPPREVFPVIPEEEIGGHPELPDFNQPGRWELIATQKAASYSAYVPDPGAPPSKIAPKHPSWGHPGDWVTILYYGSPAWAWVPTVSAGGGGETLPEPGEPETPPEEE